MFNHRSRRPVLSHSAIVSSLFLLAPAVKAACAAGTIISTGFEPPYAVQQLEGQFGWVSAGTGTSSATVQNSVKHSGSQAVQVIRAPDSDRRWAVQLDGFPTQSIVAIDWDMRVSQTPNSTSFGPFFGIEAYDDDGQPIGLLGSLGVDASTGDVLYQIQDSGVLTETGANVAFNAWHHFRLILDYNTDTYRGYFDGNLVATTGFVDRSLNLNDLSDVDISAFAAAGGAGEALASSAVFDNLVIRDGFGDYDVDGDVDAADYNLWRSSYNQTVQFPGNGADGNNNGIVDAADYVVWRKALGSGSSVGAGLENLQVPEPTIVGLVILSLPIIALAAVHRRRAL